MGMFLCYVMFRKAIVRGGMLPERNVLPLREDLPNFPLSWETDLTETILESSSRPAKLFKDLLFGGGSVRVFASMYQGNLCPERCLGSSQS